ncbi:MAG: hypothetical protein PHI34_06835 [Acidobacteriota bacterium]|nr:hypothetical protein [Acidobacteriota bacterium]
MCDWLAGYVPPAEKFVARLRDALAGRDTVEALQKRLQAEPGNPEVRIKLGRKYQDRHDRDRALPLFREAAALDPKRAIMTRTDDGGLVPCRDMAEFQEARTYIATYGTIESERMHEFVKSHPASPLLPAAYLLDVGSVDLTDARECAYFREILDRVPHDPAALAQLGQGLDRLGGKPVSSPILDAGAGYARKTKEWLEKSSPSAAAKILADFSIQKGDWEGAASSYGPDFMAGQALAWTKSLLDYAEFWRARKRNEADALAAVSSALAMRPDDAAIHQSAARIYLLDPPRTEDALTVYGPAWLGAADRPAEDLFNYFSFWMGRKANLDSALAAMDALLAKKPDDFFYLRSAIAALWQAGERDRVQALFGPAFAAAHPERLSWLFQYGLFWLQRGLNVDTAIPALVKAAADPAHPYMIKWQTAEMLDRAGRKAEVESVFGPAALESLAGDGAALSIYLSFWAGRDANSPSLARALEMLESVPNLEWSYRSQAAGVYLKRGRKDKAEAVYGPAYAATIGSHARKLVFYAEFWTAHRQNLLSAMEAVRAAVRLEPSEAEAWAALADLLQIDGKLEEARRAIDKAVGLAGGERERERYEQRRTDIAGTGPKKAG